MPPRFSLTKAEILRGYRIFSRVIAEGESFQRGVIRCFVLRGERHGAPLRVGFSVSRSIRTAADRNRARRWMKEAYRRNKAILTSQSTPAGEAMMVVFLCHAPIQAVHNSTARLPIEQSLVALLKELRSQFAGKP